MSDVDTASVTPGTQDGQPVAGECPQCHRHELVRAHIGGTSDDNPATDAAGDTVKRGTATLCPLCNIVVTPAQARTASGTARPRRKSATRRKATSTSTKRKSSPTSRKRTTTAAARSRTRKTTTRSRSRR